MSEGADYFGDVREAEGSHMKNQGGALFTLDLFLGIYGKISMYRTLNIRWSRPLT